MWSYLRDAQDWETYCRGCEQHWAAAPGSVDFGLTPDAFPLAVAAVRVGETKALTAHFTPANARQLLELRPAAATGTQAAVSAPAPPAFPTVREHAASMAAHVMTIMQFLIGTAICKPAQYAERYASNLAEVDQWTAEDWEQLQAGGRAEDVRARKPTNVPE
jgi:hypothetical protein